MHRGLLTIRTSLVAIALLATAPAAATQIILSPNAVIGNNGNFGPSFLPDNIFDDQIGIIENEIFFQGYWLNGRPGIGGDNGPADAYITIDLGQAYTLGRFELYNTSNGPAIDRGTGDFTTVGSNSVAMDGTNGFTLAGPITLLASGTLFAELGGFNLRRPQYFTAFSAPSVRYLQFRPTSGAAISLLQPPTYENSYGLNERRVFEGTASEPNIVPEPGTWAMLITGFGLIGAALRQRRRGLSTTTA